MLEFLAPHGAHLHQRLAALDVGLGLAQVGLHARQLGLAAGDLRLQRGGVGEQAAHVAHGLRQLRLGLHQVHLGVRGVEPDQRLAQLHGVVVVGVDADHRAADLRGDLHHVAAHVGVVRAFVVAAVQPGVDAPGRAGQHHHGAQDQQAALARTRRRRGGRIRVAHGRSGEGEGQSHWRAWQRARPVRNVLPSILTFAFVM
jgi:hypothetical protein